MRWFKNTPKEGDIRYVRKFLFLPLTISPETRWLEMVEIRQTYHKRRGRFDRSGWVNSNFRL